ncbi:hypothetical protein LCGC14_2939960 [marine sediment metagenome]|uniref:Uncharacterized protein n=1 Tax=marine sediment metagenome TaxID=412755 RepID=A0A0F9A9E8_9ZZZZ
MDTAKQLVKKIAAGFPEPIEGFVERPQDVKWCVRDVLKELARARKQNTVMQDALEGALRIKSLWLFEGDVKPEHEGEARAVLAMHDMFVKALAAESDQENADERDDNSKQDYQVSQGA